MKACVEGEWGSVIALAKSATVASSQVKFGIGYSAGDKRRGFRRHKFGKRLAAAKKRAARAKVLRHQVKGKVHKIFISGTRPSVVSGSKVDGLNDQELKCVQTLALQSLPPGAAAAPGGAPS